MITAALAGNPNVGKTTLFNTLTGSNQYVGNWAGVTVEKKEGYLNKEVKIVDLPGIYAMDTYSNEEIVAKEFLSTEEVDVIFNIVDASNLDRNLYLTTQLKQFKKPIVLIINMLDVAKLKGLDINFKKLEQKLKVKIIPIVASKNKGIKEIEHFLLKENFLDYVDDNDYCFPNEKATYDFIESISSDCITYKDFKKSNLTDYIDNIVLNKYLAYPLFFATMFFIFQLTFSWIGQPLADGLDFLLNEKFIPFLELALQNSSPWFTSLIIDGIVSGVGGILIFLPVILTLFIGISFLEDSGYMARAAFIMDKIMRKMGLSGKAFIPLIVGLGCSVPAIMSARTLESEKDRRLTALLVPLMSCNARLPVYALFAPIFFPGREALVVTFLYLLGIALAFILGLLFKNTLFKKDEEPFLIELPDYKMPELKNLLRHTWDKGKGFLKKAGTIIFSISVIVWLLSNFNFTGMVEINDSILASIGKGLTPLFKPLGFGTWEASVSLLTGLMAKEVVIGTMSVIYGGNLSNLLSSYFTPASALSFLVFVLLYTPCVSVIATMKKEYGLNMTVFSVFYQLILAWIMAFITFNICSLIF